MRAYVGISILHSWVGVLCTKPIDNVSTQTVHNKLMLCALIHEAYNLGICRNIAALHSWVGFLCTKPIDNVSKRICIHGHK